MIHLLLLVIPYMKSLFLLLFLRPYICLEYYYFQPKSQGKSTSISLTKISNIIMTFTPTCYQFKVNFQILLNVNINFEETKHLLNEYLMIKPQFDFEIDFRAFKPN